MITCTHPTRSSIFPTFTGASKPFACSLRHWAARRKHSCDCVPPGDFGNRGTGKTTCAHFCCRTSKVMDHHASSTVGKRVCASDLGCHLVFDLVRSCHRAVRLATMEICSPSRRSPGLSLQL